LPWQSAQFPKSLSVEYDSYAQAAEAPANKPVTVTSNTNSGITVSAVQIDNRFILVSSCFNQRCHPPTQNGSVN
jgi:hypothetical protein